ncbi:MAG: hypothetical protein B6D46_12870 [Polyangiaceae bacterium UTPRO1]|nr:MAG: hypothetical protein B6D46_12870 [Polyangiaceae bacterium UTPRO1]
MTPLHAGSSTWNSRLPLMKLALGSSETTSASKMMRKRPLAEEEKSKWPFRTEPFSCAVSVKLPLIDVYSPVATSVKVRSKSRPFAVGMEKPPYSSPPPITQWWNEILPLSSTVNVPPGFSHSSVSAARAAAPPPKPLTRAPKSGSEPCRSPWTWASRLVPGHASVMGRWAALRSTFTPSLTVIVPLPSTSQRAGVQVLLRLAAARNVCTPSVTVTVPLPSASPHTSAAAPAAQTSASTGIATRDFHIDDDIRTSGMYCR